MNDRNPRQVTLGEIKRERRERELKRESLRERELKRELKRESAHASG